MITSSGKWVLAVGESKEGEIVLIDSTNLEFKQIKLFPKSVSITYLDIYQS